MRTNASIVDIFRIRECELLYRHAYGAKHKYKRTGKMHINQWTYSDDMCTIDKVMCSYYNTCGVRPDYVIACTSISHMLDMYGHHIEQ